MRLARYALAASLALAPIGVSAGQRSIGNNTVPASNAQEVVCVDPVTGLPGGCGGGGSGGGNSAAGVVNVAPPNFAGFTGFANAGGNLVGVSPSNPLPVIMGSGSVAISNFPATQPVSGTVSVGNFPSTQPVSGTVSVGNFPTTQPVSGTVAISNFPATQPVSGSVTVGGTISVSNFPATQPGSAAAGAFVDGWNVTEGAKADSACAGSTSTCSLEARMADLEAQIAAVRTYESTIAGASTAADPCAVTTAAPTYSTGTTQATSCNTAGGLRVDGSGVTQPVSGSVTVSNFPGTQPVSGSIANPRQATASAAINISTATTTQLVALSGSTAIYVSAYDFIAAAADTVTLEYGTGTSCGTGTTALTGPYSLAANGGISKGSGIAPVLFVPAGNALCIVKTVAEQLSGSISYAQF